jgi:hypothetical protein
LNILITASADHPITGAEMRAAANAEHEGRRRRAEARAEIVR